MATAENPCAGGHPELALLVECTTFGERLPQYLCNRCGSRLGYEEAVRNDERLRIGNRIAELDAIVGSVQHYGYAYEVRDPRTGAKQLLDPKDVTVFLSRERADEFLASWEQRALRAETERAELKRQRDAVLALCERKEGDPCGTCAYAGVDVDDIRKIYGGGE